MHCVLTGVFLSLLSTLGLGFFGSPAVDGFLMTIAIAVGAIALWHGHRRHHSLIPAGFYILGLVLLFASHAPHWGHDHSHDHGINILSIAGGLSFITFHVMNLKLQRAHERGECSCCTQKVGG